MAYGRDGSIGGGPFNSRTRRVGLAKEGNHLCSNPSVSHYRHSKIRSDAALSDIGALPLGKRRQQGRFINPFGLCVDSAHRNCCLGVRYSLLSNGELDGVRYTITSPSRAVYTKAPGDSIGPISGGTFILQADYLSLKPKAESLGINSLMED